MQEHGQIIQARLSGHGLQQMTVMTFWCEGNSVDVDDNTNHIRSLKPVVWPQHWIALCWVDVRTTPASTTFFIICHCHFSFSIFGAHVSFSFFFFVFGYNSTSTEIPARGKSSKSQNRSCLICTYMYTWKYYNILCVLMGFVWQDGILILRNERLFPGMVAISLPLHGILWVREDGTFNLSGFFRRQIPKWVIHLKDEMF